MKNLNGVIVVNPFMCPAQSVKQAHRLVEEFGKLDINVKIETDGFLKTHLDGCEVDTQLKEVSFVIFLDKDKYLANIIEKNGVRMFNGAKQIFDCDDKGQTCIALSGVGVKMPKTLFAPVCYSESSTLKQEFIKRIESYLGYPVIIKKSYGSSGNGVFKADDRQQLLCIMEKLKTQPHIFQEYVSKEFGTDIRIIVIGGKAVACMKRVNQNDFRSNLGQGGSGYAIDLKDERYGKFISVAEKCANHLKMDYCGVDLLTNENDMPVVCEVNSNAFFEGIEQVTKINVAKIYAEYVLKSLR